jgi:hypothetical protein
MLHLAHLPHYQLAAFLDTLSSMEHARLAIPIAFIVEILDLDIATIISATLDMY